MAGIVLFCSVLTVLTFSIRIKADIQEACSYETLEAACPSGHVILLRRARYGRLHEGRCIKRQFGLMGCSADVLRIIEPMCSGRSQCGVPVFQTLQDERPEKCAELEAFLQIEFDCVPVISLPRQQCSERKLSVQDPQGYLPSFYSENDINVIGRHGCSVELIAKPGQIWNLTLLNFGKAEEIISSDRELLAKADGIWCTRYAVVKETADGSEKMNVVCGSDEVREKNIYLSETNTIKIDMNLDVQSTYLIAFKAIGCVVPDGPGITHVKQEKASHTFYCNKTGESWTLECKGSHWQGHHKPCGAVPITSPRTSSSDWNSTTGLVIVVGLGLLLGVVIGTTLLGLVVCYYRRYRQPPPPQEYYTATTYGCSPKKDTISLYKTYGKSPDRAAPGTTSSIEYGRRTAPSVDTHRYPYQSCQSGGGHLVSSTAPENSLVNVPRVVIREEDMTSLNVTPGTNISQYGGCKPTSDSSSSSDHVYEIPS